MTGRLCSLAVLAAALAQSTPPAGRVVRVAAGADLQAAIEHARDGDTLLLQAGATYTGNYVLPARADATGIVTIRTENDDGLPADGERISPEAAPHLAKLQSPNSSPALATAPRARGWRVALVEIGPNRDGVGDIVTLGDGSAAQSRIEDVPSDLTLDRVYIHGDPRVGQKRGVALNSGTATITGCYVADIKAIGQDSQAVLGWNGPGPYLIENNYLEAAGENVMFGSADPSIRDLVPSRIVVRRNLMSKPIEWRDPAAPRWQIKNVFELKNARQVIVEANVIERSWEQAQTGYAVLFTVRNQDGHCPWCVVEDVEFRGNIVQHAGGGVQITGVDSNNPTRQTNGIRIHDNLFDDIDRRAWGGDGYFLQLSDSPRDVSVEHNTIVQGESGGLIKIANGITLAFRFANNIGSHGSYGIIGTNHGVGNDSISAYLPGAVVTQNVIAGGNGSAYPPGNRFPTVDEFRKQFVAFARHDYHLTVQSAWRNAASDGRDLGADLATLPTPPGPSGPRIRR
jgi:hypothetical protein